MKGGNSRARRGDVPGGRRKMNREKQSRPMIAHATYAHTRPSSPAPLFAILARTLHGCSGPHRVCFERKRKRCRSAVALGRRAAGRGWRGRRRRRRRRRKQLGWNAVDMGWHYAAAEHERP